MFDEDWIRFARGDFICRVEGGSDVGLKLHGGMVGGQEILDTLFAECREANTPAFVALSRIWLFRERIVTTKILAVSMALLFHCLNLATWKRAFHVEKCQAMGWVGTRPCVGVV